jgi:hypothetical protein
MWYKEEKHLAAPEEVAAMLGLVESFTTLCRDYERYHASGQQAIAAFANRGKPVKPTEDMSQP